MAGRRRRMPNTDIPAWGRRGAPRHGPPPPDLPRPAAAEEGNRSNGHANEFSMVDGRSRVDPGGCSAARASGRTDLCDTPGGRRGAAGRIRTQRYLGPDEGAEIG